MQSITVADACIDVGRAARFVPAFGPTFAEALVDPAGVFRNPAEVVEHPWFTHEEKRTVLLSWARDELVLEQVANRAMPELRPRSRIDAVIDALSQFDASAAAEFCMAVASIRAGNLRRVSGEPATIKSRRDSPCRTA